MLLVGAGALAVAPQMSVLCRPNTIVAGFRYALLAATLIFPLNLSGQTLPPGTVADKLIVNKTARSLHVYSGGQLLKTYRIALGRNPKGHKTQEGDGRTPEGNYVIDWRKPDSVFHRALHISYPNAEDRKRARTLGVSPGGAIMIHGLPKGMAALGAGHARRDWTEGCVAVTNPEIEELWRIVPNGTRIEIKP